AASGCLGSKAVAPDDALDHSVTSYLRGFGPASKGDIADYLALKKRDLDPALARIELRHFRAEAGAALLDLPRAPLPEADTPAPPRFLPVWDATLLVHARRTGILPEK